MRRHTIFAASALVLALTTACAGVNPFDNPQAYSGINEVEATFQVPEGKSGPTWVKVIGGKEQEAVGLTLDLPDGTRATYTASGVKAFDGVALRAAVEQAISNDVKEAAPGIVDSVVAAVIKAVVP